LREDPGGGWKRGQEGSVFSDGVEGQKLKRRKKTEGAADKNGGGNGGKKKKKQLAKRRAGPK